jgi:hypothetical protein
VGSGQGTHASSTPLCCHPGTPEDRAPSCPFVLVHLGTTKPTLASLYSGSYSFPECLFVFCVQVDSCIEVISLSCLTDMRVASPPHQGQPLAVPASPPPPAFCRSSGSPGAGTGFSFADGTEVILAHAPAPLSGRPHHARRPLAPFSLSSLVPSLGVRPPPNVIYL